MQEYKIIFAGSMGAGKTTAITALSEISVINTDVVNTDRSAHKKAMTTVGIDYGQVIIPPDLKLGLYGTPGQDRFRFVWQVVTSGAIGVIVIIDSTADNALNDVSHYIDFFAEQGMENIVVGLSHADEQHARSLEEFLAYVADKQYPYPIFTIDARERSDVLLLVETLIASAEAALY